MHTPDTSTRANMHTHAPLLFADESTHDSSGDGDTLDDAARDEKEYVRSRLRDELGREPTDEEIDEWLRDHTEGY
jgi:hypothetical protein